jgi:hypothetical protein
VTDFADSLPELGADALLRAAPLAGIGRKCGDLVTGLSAVRRAKDLALVIVAADISRHTLSELARLQQGGTQVFRTPSLAPFTGAFGRTDLQVIAVKRGNLARGLMAKLGSPPG